MAKRVLAVGMLTPYAEVKYTICIICGRPLEYFSMRSDTHTGVCANTECLTKATPTKDEHVGPLVEKIL